ATEQSAKAIRGLNNSIAKFLSYIFHPLLMATYVVGCLFYFAPQAVNAEVLPPQSLGILLVAIMAYTFVIPVLFVYGLQQLRMIQSLLLQTLEERRLPLWITVMVYAAATYFFGWKFVHLGAISTVLSVILGSITVSI